MGAVLTFCEVSGSTIRTASLHALTAARELASAHGGSVVAVVIGQGVAAAANDVASSAAPVIAVDPARSGPARPAPPAPLSAAAAQPAGATAVVATATSTGKDVLPRAAALRGAPSGRPRPR